MGATCSQHPDRPAKAVCRGCARQLCSGCVELPLESPHEHCVVCHAVTDRLAPPVEVVAEPQAPRASLPTATIVGAGAVIAREGDSPVTKVMRYLFARETLWTLFALTIFTTLLRELGGGWVMAGGKLWIIAAGLETAYYFRVLTSVAQGDPHFETPDISNLGEDVFDPLIRYLATFVPAVIAVLQLGAHTTGHMLDGPGLLLSHPAAIFDHPGPGLLFGGWLVLWPLMTTIAAIGKSVIAAYNPVIWIKTLRALGTRYAIGASIFYALLILETYVFPELSPLTAIPILGVLAIQLVANLAMALRGCVLGIVCEPFT